MFFFGFGIRPQCTVAIDYRILLYINVDMQYENVLKIESVNFALQYVLVVHRAFSYRFSTYTVRKASDFPVPSRDVTNLLYSVPFPFMLLFIIENEGML